MDGPTQATFYAKNSRMIAINEEDGTIYLDASYNYNDLAPETAIAIGEKLTRQEIVELINKLSEAQQTAMIDRSYDLIDKYDPFNMAPMKRSLLNLICLVLGIDEGDDK